MCIEGQLIAALMAQMMKFAQLYYTSAADLCQNAIRAWAAVYLSWALIDLALGKGRDPKEVTEQILSFIVIDGLFLAPGLVWDFIDVIMSSGVYLAGLTAKANGQGDQGGDMATLTCYAHWRH